MNYKSDIIYRAREFAILAHRDQFRDSGEPYFAHPEQVAEILKQVTYDPAIIAAGYLHDVIEDCDVTYEDLKVAFGQRVADLVREVTSPGDSNTFPNLKTRDGVLIKFADRLSNLSSMDVWSDAKQARYIKKSTFWKKRLTRT